GHCDVFFFSSRRRHTSFSRDWSSDVCSSDLRLLLLDAVLVGRRVGGSGPGAQPEQAGGEEQGQGELGDDTHGFPLRVRVLRNGRSEERRVGKVGGSGGLTNYVMRLEEVRECR